MPFLPYTIDPRLLERAAVRYRGARPPPLGYGTVRDFSDSVEHLPELATVNHDLKDLQRPWILKAIVGAVPPGSTLIEIGAGDPHVAHWLSLLGYRVWIVDPYDGSGHGPTDYDFYREHFPDLHLVRETFSEHLSETPDDLVDCIYSISVLEHIPHSELRSVMQGIRRFSRPKALTIHAVDHV
ncbi:MAG: class I SAM-dependent methyltransferase, partial [Opitutaceae bacterium]